MRKLTKEFDVKRSCFVFAIFMLAAFLNRLTFIILPAAMAQDKSISAGADAYISVDNNYTLTALSEENLEEIILRDNIFVQSSCSAGGMCPSREISVAGGQKTTMVAAARSIVTTTAYSSTPDQTDDSPFITANGSYVYDGVVACNFLPFGVKVRFPEIYGNKVFTVEDRMAKKNNHKIDIWMPSRQAALQFGIKHLAVEILK